MAAAQQSAHDSQVQQPPVPHSHVTIDCGPKPMQVTVPSITLQPAPGLSSSGPHHVQLQTGNAGFQLEVAGPEQQARVLALEQEHAARLAELQAAHANALKGIMNPEL